MIGVTPRRFAVATGSSAALLLAAIAVGVALGEVPADVLGALSGSADPTSAAIVLGARLPRVLLAAGVGALLAVAGTLFQGVLRNPLADPFILGASGGAALGAILATLGGELLRAVPFSRTGAALAGAFAALALVFLAARRAGGVPSHTLVLVGVVVNALASAAILLAIALLDPDRSHGVLLWLSGSLGYPRLADAALAAAALAVGLAIALPRARELDLLAAGEESAAALGVDVPRARRWLLGVGGLCAGAAVGEAGPVGFVGLVVPHAIRRLSGAEHRLLLPVAAGVGGTLLVGADLGARTAFAPRVLPVGVFTAMLGAPAFLWLLRRGPAGLWARAPLGGGRVARPSERPEGGAENDATGPSSRPQQRVPAERGSQAMTSPLLAAEAVTAGYGPEPVLRGVSIALSPGELVGLLGPNGAGKTTLLRALAGTLAPREGRVLLDGRPLAGLARRDVARDVGLVPQESDEPTPFRAGEVVLMGRAPRRGGFSFDGPEDLEAARAAMAAVGVESLAPRYLDRLSGGERQRVRLARALAQEPRALLLDEPTAQLDLRNRFELYALLDRLRRERGLAVLVVSHDLDLLLARVDRAVLLAGGKVVAEGPPAEVGTPERIAAAFGLDPSLVQGPRSTVRNS